MNIPTTLIAAAACLAMSGGAALAGQAAIANGTTTSMAAPTGSPGFAAPRSAVVPGLPPQTEEAQSDNAAGGRGNEGAAGSVRAPTNPVTGRTQVTH